MTIYIKNKTVHNFDFQKVQNESYYKELKHLYIARLEGINEDGKLDTLISVLKEVEKAEVGEDGDISAVYKPNTSLTLGTTGMISDQEILSLTFSELNLYHCIGKISTLLLDVKKLSSLHSNDDNDVMEIGTAVVLGSSALSKAKVAEVIGCKSENVVIVPEYATSTVREFMGLLVKEDDLYSSYENEDEDEDEGIVTLYSEEVVSKDGEEHIRVVTCDFEEQVLSIVDVDADSHEVVAGQVHTFPADGASDEAIQYFIEHSKEEGVSAKLKEHVETLYDVTPVFTDCAAGLAPPAGNTYHTVDCFTDAA